MAEKNRESKGSLKHTAGGVTTRDDALDMGVDMLPGDPSEPVGPEDALGSGPKRGDYSGRLGDSYYNPHQSVAVENPKPGEPHTRVVKQAPLASEQGEEKGKKGGVSS